MAVLPRKLRGRAAEAAVATHLQSVGCQVLVRNFRGRRGEIDLIIRDGTVLAFVEVKARRAGALTPLHAVDARKRRRIATVALQYVTERKLTGVSLRFDVAAVVLDDKGHPTRVTYLRDAFFVGE